MSIATRINTILTEALSPDALEIKDVSHLHEGHAGHDGQGESHFVLTVVSDKFEGMGRVARHRMMYDLLKTEMSERIHALSIKAFTPSEGK